MQTFLKNFTIDNKIFFTSVEKFSLKQLENAPSKIIG